MRFTWVISTITALVLNGNVEAKTLHVGDIPVFPRPYYCLTEQSAFGVLQTYFLYGEDEALLNLAKRPDCFITLPIQAKVIAIGKGLQMKDGKTVTILEVHVMPTVTIEVLQSIFIITNQPLGSPT